MTPQPAKGSLHNPAARKNVKAFDCVGPFHNLQPEAVAVSQRSDPLDQFSSVSPIGPNEPDTQIGIAYQREEYFGAVSILNVGCMNDYGNNQPQRVYEQMPFAAIDLLAGIISMEPPFSVVLTDWLSRMAALGSASRPSAMRTWDRSASWTCVHVPSRRHDEK
jgi:hypothetical protein